MYHDYQTIFKEIIIRDWFQEYGVVNPDIAAEEWSKWINNPRNRGLEEKKYYYRACELAIGKEKVKQFYDTTNPDNINRFGESVKRVLDRITYALIGALPKDSKIRLPAHRKTKGPIRDTFNRIALVTKLSDLSSFPYYLEVIGQITLAAQKRNFLVSIHNIKEEELFNPLDKIIHTFRPSGIILIRRAPDQVTSKYLAGEGIPVMLINADDMDYNGSVIGNIIPAYPEEVNSKFVSWLSKTSTDSSNPSNTKVVIAAMQPRTSSDTHRKRRIDFMRHAVLAAGLTPMEVYVPNYGFQNALAIWQEHNDAQLFLSLSDQIAVAIKSILIARQEYYCNRVVGFDNTAMAINENIPSFGQSMEKFGELSINRLIEEFEKRKRSDDYRFEFRRINAEVQFFDRVTA